MTSTKVGVASESSQDQNSDEKSHTQFPFSDLLSVAPNAAQDVVKKHRSMTIVGKPMRIQSARLRSPTNKKVSAAARKTLELSGDKMCDMCLRVEHRIAKKESKPELHFGHIVEMLSFQVDEEVRQMKYCKECKRSSELGLASRITLVGSSNNWVPVLYTVLLSPVTWILLAKFHDGPVVLGVICGIALAVMFLVHLPMLWAACYCKDTSPQGNMERNFNIFDQDGDTEITRQEFGKIINDLEMAKPDFEDFTEKEIDAMYNEIDTDNSNGIDRKEFRNIVKVYIERNLENQSNRYSKLDPNFYFNIQNHYNLVNPWYPVVMVLLLVCMNLLIIPKLVASVANGQNIAYGCYFFDQDELSNRRTQTCLSYLHSAGCSLVIFFCICGMTFAVMRNVNYKMKFKTSNDFLKNTRKHPWVRKKLQDILIFEDCSSLAMFGYGLHSFRILFCCCTCSRETSSSSSPSSSEAGKEIEEEIPTLALVTDEDRAAVAQPENKHSEDQNDEEETPNDKNDRDGGDDEQTKIKKRECECACECDSEALTELSYWYDRIWFICVWAISIIVSLVSLFNYGRFVKNLSTPDKLEYTFSSFITASTMVLLFSTISKTAKVYKKAAAISSLCAQPIYLASQFAAEIEPEPENKRKSQPAPESNAEAGIEAGSEDERKQPEIKRATGSEVEAEADAGAKREPGIETEYAPLDVWWNFRCFVFDCVLEQIYEHLNPFLTMLFFAIIVFSAGESYYFFYVHKADPRAWIDGTTNSNIAPIVLWFTVFLVVGGFFVLNAAFKPFKMQEEHAAMLKQEIIDLQFRLGNTIQEQNQNQSKKITDVIQQYITTAEYVLDYLKEDKRYPDLIGIALTENRLIALKSYISVLSVVIAGIAWDEWLAD